MNRAFLSKVDNLGRLDRHDVRAFRGEMLISYTAVVITLVAIAAFFADCVEIILSGEAGQDVIAELVVGRTLVGFFMFSGLVYLLNRIGYLRRASAHRSAPASELERIYDCDAPSLAFLVPSFKEEPHVVRQTLISAALQQSPNRRIVLLIDDPPEPCNKDDAAKLAAVRSLPGEINQLFAASCKKFEQALDGFLQRREQGTVNRREEISRLARLLRDAAEWVDRLAENTAENNHTDSLFIQRILWPPARSHRSRAFALLTRRDSENINLLLEYRRLAALFRVEVTGFERKRYVNLSHEANKAMNLNSYIALMGKRFKEVESPEGLLLKEANDSHATLRVTKFDFIIVLDADSLILSEYSLRLIHFMTRPGNERVAVVQTPYAAVPGAASTIERTAGATTDVQLMSHQGSTLFGAGSWVGASALVRRSALDDIAFVQEERGYLIPSFIRDRTLNEDTDTTVELVRNDWTVHNYPARLSYSATPGDFGSLLIQRR